MQKQLEQNIESIRRQEKFGLEPKQQKLRTETTAKRLESSIELLSQLQAVREEAMEGDQLQQAKFVHERLIPLMNALREQIDGLEHLCERSRWPYPSYEELLFTL